MFAQFERLFIIFDAVRFSRASWCGRTFRLINARAAVMGTAASVAHATTPLVSTKLLAAIGSAQRGDETSAFLGSILPIEVLAFRQIKISKRYVKSMFATL